MAFDELTDLFDPDLRLPINGKVYRVPPPSAVVGLRLQALQALATKGALSALRPSERQRLILSDDEELSLHRDALGPVYDELIADGVNIEYLRHAGNTAYLCWVNSRAHAEEHWRSHQGEAPRPLSTTAAAPATTGTAGESTTPSPRHGSGTSSRPRSKPAGKAAPAVKAAGTKSSPSGRLSKPTSTSGTTST